MQAPNSSSSGCVVLAGAAQQVVRRHQEIHVSDSPVDHVKIGLLLPTTGVDSAQGTDTTKGFEL
jgi:hypothetical protein